MALKNRLPYSQRLFFLLVFFAGILMSGFILFQYEREKQFKIENLNIQLQLLNAQIIDAINNGKSLDKITLHFQNRYPDLPHSHRHDRCRIIRRPQRMEKRLHSQPLLPPRGHASHQRRRRLHDTPTIGKRKRRLLLLRHTYRPYDSTVGPSL